MAAVTAHVARVFPRYYNLTNVMTDIGNYVDTKNFRPDEALTFWLGGFNPDPTQPFLNLKTLTRAQRTPAFMTFEPTRLVSLVSSTSTVACGRMPGLRAAGEQEQCPVRLL